MKQFFNTIKNIYSIEELRSKIIFTIGLIFLFRLGAHVVLPGINGDILQNMLADKAGDSRGLTDLFDMFAGGAFNRASIFALGIMPYISASIVFQLLGMTVPFIQKIQKEGESGRRKINQYTRIATIVITLFQASGYVTYLNFQYKDAIVIDPSLFWLTTTVVLTAGTIFVMWLGEKITDKGIGNGISILIMIGIIARLPSEFIIEIDARGLLGGDIIAQPIMVLIEIVFMLAIILASVLLVQGTRRIPVTYAKKLMGNASAAQSGGARQYIPLKVNASGVMPIIFAQALMFIPAMVGQFKPEEFEALDGVFAALTNSTSFTYNIVLAIMVVLFTYFYTAIIFNPTQMADELKKNGAFIPGVKPGLDTANLIDTIMSRVTLPGALFLAMITIIPAFAAHPDILGVQPGFAMFFGGTSLLIMVGVVLDTMQQIESHLLMRHYDGLTKSGKLKGRNNPSPVSTTTAI